MARASKPRIAVATGERVAGAPRLLGVEARLERNLSELVVGFAFLGIGKHRVGLRDRLEPLLGGWVVGVHVRVQFARELAH